MNYEELKEQHAVHGGVAELFRRTIVEQIDVILEKNKLTLGVPIESRVKTVNSIVNKDKRKTLKIDSIIELDDFIGIRLIMLFKRDVEKVVECLESNFDVIKSENKLDDLDEDKFGYQSYHYIIKIPSDWVKIPSFSNFIDYKVEIQVRTLSQHIWAATSHKLQYKREKNIPLPLRRAIHRVSALLEVVDFEFERVLNERVEYLGSLHDDVDFSRDQTLNIDILKIIANKELPSKNKDGEEDFDEILSELVFNEISDVGALVDNLKKGLPKALKEDKRVAKLTLEMMDEQDDDNDVERAKLGVYFSHVGLIRMAMSYALDNKYIKFEYQGADD